jgi:serine/threonine protein kinase
MLANAAIGEYRLLESLGAGGMGEVYRAIHSRIGRVVAVKILSGAEPGPGLAERFINEARIQAGLHHPHIAELYDFVEFDGRPCIIMEYVDGITLHDRIQRARGGMPASEALTVFRAVVEAIAYLHGRGILHRDIKSSNIKLSSSGQVKLLDFGIAKDPGSKRLTMVGGCVGTMDYLAPEQIRGKSADARADVWSLGVLFYEMLTANMPFAADSVGVLCERISRAEYRTPTLASPLSADLQRIIGRCLRSDAAERYHDARELLDDLGQIGQSPPALTPAAERRISIRRVVDLAGKLASDRRRVFACWRAVCRVLLEDAAGNRGGRSTQVKPGACGARRLAGCRAAGGAYWNDRRACRYLRRRQTAWHDGKGVREAVSGRGPCRIDAQARRT